MNLTTVRTHQFAVWITIGFFEVKRPGNPSSLHRTRPWPSDLLGTESGCRVAAASAIAAFFVLDRSRAGGLNPARQGLHPRCGCLSATHRVTHEHIIVR